MDTIESKREEIISLLLNTNIETTINSLIELLHNQADAYKNLLLINMSYKAVQKSNLQGIIDYSQFAREENNVRKRLLSLIYSLNDKDIVAYSFFDKRDGKVYRTVYLMGKVWFAENLDYKIGEGCYDYCDNPNIASKYGKLYTWSSALKACPPGWRIPSDDEWKELLLHMGGYNDIMGEIGSSISCYENLVENKDVGFNALLGGYRNSDGSYSNLKKLGGYWSRTEINLNDAYYYRLSKEQRRIFRYEGLKKSYAYCRCIKTS